jgi:hypothetical protein
MSRSSSSLGESQCSSQNCSQPSNARFTATISTISLRCFQTVAGSSCLAVRTAKSEPTRAESFSTILRTTRCQRCWIGWRRRPDRPRPLDNVAARVRRRAREHELNLGSWMHGKFLGSGQSRRLLPYCWSLDIVSTKNNLLAQGKGISKLRVTGLTEPF